MNNPVLLRKIKAVTADFPPAYNAHKDRLADEWDHCESVNTLLRVLREVETALEKKT